MAARYPDVQFSQFTGAEMIAENYGIEKASSTRYALRSHRSAIAATAGRRVRREIVPVAVRLADGTRARRTARPRRRHPLRRHAREHCRA